VTSSGVSCYRAVKRELDTPKLPGDEDIAVGIASGVWVAPKKLFLATMISEKKQGRMLERKRDGKRGSLCPHNLVERQIEKCTSSARESKWGQKKEWSLQRDN